MSREERELRLLRVVAAAAKELRAGDGVETFPRSGLWKALDELEKLDGEEHRDCPAGPDCSVCKAQRYAEAKKAQ